MQLCIPTTQGLIVQACLILMNCEQNAVLGDNCFLLRMRFIKCAIHSHGDGELIQVAILPYLVDNSG